MLYVYVIPWLIENKVRRKVKTGMGVTVSNYPSQHCLLLHKRSDPWHFGSVVRAGVSWSFQCGCCYWSNHETWAEDDLNSQTCHRIGFGFFTPTNSHDFKLWHSRPERLWAGSSFSYIVCLCVKNVTLCIIFIQHLPSEKLAYITHVLN